MSIDGSMGVERKLREGKVEGPPRGLRTFMGIIDIFIILSKTYFY